jgi:hypothetical protein
VNAATRAHIGRIVRLVAFTLFSAAITTPLVRSWEVQWPVVGTAIGRLEVIYRTAVPTVAAPTVASVLAPPAQPGPGTS